MLPVNFIQMQFFGKDESFMSEILHINNFLQIFEDDLHIQNIRSGGPGGQHVNRVSTGVRLIFIISSDTIFDERILAKLLKGLENRLIRGNELHMTCTASRSAHANRQEIIHRFITLLQNVLRPQKKRIPTKISRKKKAARVENKRRRGETKKLRKPPKE
jgi:ribosome-associated protein